MPRPDSPRFDSPRFDSPRSDVLSTRQPLTADHRAHEGDDEGVRGDGSACSDRGSDSEAHAPIHTSQPCRAARDSSPRATDLPWTVSLLASLLLLVILQLASPIVSWPEDEPSSSSLFLLPLHLLLALLALAASAPPTLLLLSSVQRATDTLLRVCLLSCALAFLALAIAWLSSYAQWDGGSERAFRLLFESQALTSASVAFATVTLLAACRRQLHQATEIITSTARMAVSRLFFSVHLACAAALVIVTPVFSVLASGALTVRSDLPRTGAALCALGFAAFTATWTALTVATSAAFVVTWLFAREHKRYLRDADASADSEGYSTSSLLFSSFGTICAFSCTVTATIAFKMAILIGIAQGMGASWFAALLCWASDCVLLAWMLFLICVVLPVCTVHGRSFRHSLNLAVHLVSHNWQHLLPVNAAAVGVAVVAALSSALITMVGGLLVGFVVIYLVQLIFRLEDSSSAALFMVMWGYLLMWVVAPLSIAIICTVIVTGVSTKVVCTVEDDAREALVS